MIARNDASTQEGEGRYCGKTERARWHREEGGRHETIKVSPKKPAAKKKAPDPLLLSELEDFSDLDDEAAPSKKTIKKAAPKKAAAPKQAAAPKKATPKKGGAAKKKAADPPPPSESEGSSESSHGAEPLEAPESSESSESSESFAEEDASTLKKPPAKRKAGDALTDEEDLSDEVLKRTSTKGTKKVASKGSFSCKRCFKD